MNARALSPKNLAALETLMVRKEGTVQHLTRLMGRARAARELLKSG